MSTVTSFLTNRRTVCPGRSAQLTIFELALQTALVSVIKLRRERTLSDS